MVQCPDKKNDALTDKAAERLHLFENSRAPQELPDDPVLDFNEPIQASLERKKDVTHKLQQQDDGLSGNKQEKF